MTTKSITIPALSILAGTMLLNGCVDPDPDQPWSTRGESVTLSDADVAMLRPQVGTTEVVYLGKDLPRGKRIEVLDQIPIEIVETRVVETPVIVDALSPRESAVDLLVHAAHDDQPMLRAYAFEGLQHAPESLREVGELGLKDENRGVRFIATMAIGKSGLESMSPAIEPLLQDSSPSVQAAAIFALNTLGTPVNPNPLGGMASSNNPEIRANAYMVLGLLGNASAIGMIDSTLGKGMKLANPMRVRLTDLQAAEALVRLGQVEEVEPIRAALFAPVEQGELSILACDMLGRLQDQQARSMLMRLITAPDNQRRPLEIRMAAATAIFRLDPPFAPVVQTVIMEGVNDPDPRRRIQATAGLAISPSPEATSVLTSMMQDEDPTVRIAAAAGLVQRLDP